LDAGVVGLSVLPLRTEIPVEMAQLWEAGLFHGINSILVLFGTLKVQSFMLTEDLLFVVTSFTFLKRKDMLKEKSS